MISSRLFRKLFFSFFLATIASFAIGAAIVGSNQRGMLGPSGIADHALFEATRQVLRSDGLDAVLPLLRQQSARTGVLALYDRRGHWIAGNRELTDDTCTVLVRSGDQVYRLVGTAHRPFQFFLGVPFLAGAVVSLLFSLAIAWRLARPLTRLSEGFRSLGEGKLGTRLYLASRGPPDEIHRLAADFDKMAEQLQRLADTHQRFFHDISHELRSPLARLEVVVGLLRQSPESLGSMLPRITHEIGRLDCLIEELLTLARLRSGVMGAPAERLDVVDLLGAIVEDAHFEAQSIGCAVRLVADSPYVMKVHGELLYRAFENVIRNAVRHAPAGSVVTVHSRTDANGLEIAVVDQGLGVPADTIEMIFEPFRRIEEIEQSSRGFGLGLAIAKHAIEAHEGTIRASVGDHAPGLTVTINLPRLPSAACAFE